MTPSARLARDRLPFLRWTGAQGPRHRTPSRIAHEDRFFRFGRVAVFYFYQFECSDGFDVGEGFSPEAAFADVVGCGYPEVAGGGFFFVVLESADDRCGGRFSLRRKANSWVTVSHAVW
jgi:hypothetical protein